MQVKLINPVQGKFGTYPADEWLEAHESDGFIFINHPTHPNMRLKRVARSNIKEIKDESMGTK